MPSAPSAHCRAGPRLSQWSAIYDTRAAQPTEEDFAASGCVTCWVLSYGVKGFEGSDDVRQAHRTLMTPSGEATSRSRGLNRMSVFPCCTAASACTNPKSALIPAPAVVSGSRPQKIRPSFHNHQHSKPESLVQTSMPASESFLLWDNLPPHATCKASV
jgi:hypothetical protein